MNSKESQGMSFEITPVGGVYRCNGIEFRFERQALLSRVILYCQKMAVKTDNLKYYQRMLNVNEEIRENLAAIREVMEKYPYDGKSSFAELLEQATKEMNANKHHS